MIFTLFLTLMVAYAAYRLVRHEIAERSPSPRPGRGEGVSHGDPTAVTVDGAIVAWMISHPNTVLAVYQDEVEE
jgi:hypothetical protein